MSKLGQLVVVNNCSADAFFVLRLDSSLRGDWRPALHGDILAWQVRAKDSIVLSETGGGGSFVITPEEESAVWASDLIGSSRVKVGPSGHPDAYAVSARTASGEPMYSVWLYRRPIYQNRDLQWVFKIDC
jgi:hypothetical protein